MSDTKVKTYIAVRPGMQSSLAAQFPGMEIVVEPGLVGDFEFRKRELSGIELIEAQLEEEEKAASDPRNAKTILVPVIGLDQTADEYWADAGTDSSGSPSFLVIRCAPSTPVGRVIQIVGDIRGVKSTQSWNDEEYINKGATGANILAALKAEDIEVYSISEVNEIAPLKL